MLKSILPVLLVFTSACSSPLSKADRLSQEDDIREAIFRHQFTHNASGQQKHARFYCLSVGENDNDPTDELLKRFADHKPPVLKRSDCHVHPFTGVSNNRTGTRSLIFRVSGITWISDKKVKAEGGYYEDGLSSSGNIYTVTKQHRKWMVSDDQMKWIS
jgi:hypothetical protein